MKYGNIEIKSLVLYGGMEEQFANLSPLYAHACKAWEAAANGQSLEDIQALGSIYEEYEEWRIKAEGLEKNQDRSPEQQAEYEKAMTEATKLALKITKGTSVVAGLNQDQKERLASKRQELLDLMNQIIGIIANGLRKKDLETKVASLEDFMSLREPVKKRLIYDVSAEPENGQPLGFTQRLGEITPVLLNSHLSQATPKSSQTSTAGDKVSE